MIQLNLLPDVKLQFLHAQRVRASVVSISILVAIISLAIVGLIFLWMIGQQARELLLDNSIKDQSQKLSSIDAINNAVTIQNQLEKIDELHDSKNSVSRIFSVLTAIALPAPSTVDIKDISVDTDGKTIVLQAQAASGYPAYEKFRKTIEATQFSYKGGSSDSSKTVPLVSEITDLERSYKDNGDGTNILNFCIRLKYDEHLFASNIKDFKVVTPNPANVTDSYVGVPNALFIGDSNKNGGNQ